MKSPVFPSVFRKVLHLSLACSLLAIAPQVLGDKGPEVKIDKQPSSLTFQTENGPIASYNLKRIEESRTPNESGGFFHPVYTPKGIVITDLAPDDHPHHRGVFMGWVEMHGAKDADFWGWGEHAPTTNRTIFVRSVKGSGDKITARNEWVADDTVLIKEEMKATASTKGRMNLIDIEYKFTPQSDIVLSQWAFSGFCLRTRKDGKIEYHSPSGVARFPNPIHTKPISNWPNQNWYAATVNTGQNEFSVAVLNHRDNPQTLWHNHRDVRMINPCIVAPGEIKLKKGKALVLKYMIVAADGPVPTGELNDLSSMWNLD